MSAVGVALFGVPAYDIWDDASNLCWGITATFVENSVLIVLALLLVAGGVWLAQREWPNSDVRLAAKWTVSGALVTASVYALVIALQLDAMSELKPYVLADDILDDVLANLLRNAVEHNDKEQVEIEVVATETDDGVRVEVADNGPGIPESERDQVFRRGVSNAQAGGPGGSGFGLFFIDTMIDSYGGDVHVEDNEHEGARFVVMFDEVI